MYTVAVVTLAHASRVSYLAWIRICERLDSLGDHVEKKKKWRSGAIPGRYKRRNGKSEIGNKEMGNKEIWKWSSLSVMTISIIGVWAQE